MRRFLADPGPKGQPEGPEGPAGQLPPGAPAGDVTHARRLHFCLPACYATVRLRARSSEVLEFILASLALTPQRFGGATPTRHIRAELMASLCPDVAPWGGAPTLATNLQLTSLGKLELVLESTDSRLDEGTVLVGGARGRDWNSTLARFVWKAAGVGVPNTLHFRFCNTHFPLNFSVSEVFRVSSLPWGNLARRASLGPSGPLWGSKGDFHRFSPPSVSHKSLITRGSH